MLRTARLKCLSVAFLLALGGCASPGPDVQQVCPKIKSYSQAEQDQIKAEKNALASDAYLRTVLFDYEAVRDEVRAACPVPKK